MSKINVAGKKKNKQTVYQCAGFIPADPNKKGWMYVIEKDQEGNVKTIERLTLEEVKK